MTSIVDQWKYVLCLHFLQRVLTRPGGSLQWFTRVYRTTVHNMHNFPSFFPALLTYFLDRKGMLVVAQQTNGTSIFD